MRLQLIIIIIIFNACLYLFTAKFTGSTRSKKTSTTPCNSIQEDARLLWMESFTNNSWQSHLSDVNKTLNGYNYIHIMNDNSHNATMIMIITVPFGFRSKIGLKTSPFMWMNFTFSIKELCFRCEARTAKYSARLWWYLRLRKSFGWKHSCRKKHNTI